MVWEELLQVQTHSELTGALDMWGSSEAAVVSTNWEGHCGKSGKAHWESLTPSCSYCSSICPLPWHGLMVILLLHMSCPIAWPHDHTAPPYVLSHNMASWSYCSSTCPLPWHGVIIMIMPPSSRAEICGTLASGNCWVAPCQNNFHKEESGSVCGRKPVQAVLGCYATRFPSTFSVPNPGLVGTWPHITSLISLANRQSAD